MAELELECTGKVSAICLLIRLPKDNGGDYWIMIDCGVILGTPDSTQKMQAVVKDVLATTGGHLDLLLATHEHWDHLSGFYLARDIFNELKGKANQVWFAWTEDPKDQLAKELRAERKPCVLPWLPVRRDARGWIAELSQKIAPEWHVPFRIRSGLRWCNHRSGWFQHRRQ